MCAPCSVGASCTIVSVAPPVEAPRNKPARKRPVAVLQKKPKHIPRFSQPQPPHSGNNTEKERKQTREKKRNMVTPRETTLKATKKDPHVSGIKQKVTKQLKQQHPKPAGKRRGKENRETKKKQDKHRNRAGKTRLRHERSTIPKAARHAHRRTACTCALVLHGIRRRRRRPKPRPYPASGVHWWGQKKSQTTGTHRRKRRTWEAANKRPLAQQNTASQYMSILHEVYSGIGARATVPSHRVGYGYPGPP